MAGMLRAEVNLAAANGLYLVLLLLGGMLVPLAKLPHALADVAKALPAAALSGGSTHSSEADGRSRSSRGWCWGSGRWWPRPSPPSPSAGSELRPR